MWELGTVGLCLLVTYFCRVSFGNNLEPLSSFCFVLSQATVIPDSDWYFPSYLPLCLLSAFCDAADHCCPGTEVWVWEMCDCCLQWLPLTLHLWRPCSLVTQPAVEHEGSPNPSSQPYPGASLPCLSHAGHQVIAHATWVVMRSKSSTWIGNKRGRKIPRSFYVHGPSTNQKNQLIYFPLMKSSLLNVCRCRSWLVGSCLSRLLCFPWLQRLCSLAYHRRAFCWLTPRV